MPVCHAVNVIKECWKVDLVEVESTMVLCFGFNTVGSLSNAWKGQQRKTCFSQRWLRIVNSMRVFHSEATKDFIIKDRKWRTTDSFHCSIFPCSAMSASEISAAPSDANGNHLKQGNLLLSIYGYAPCPGKCCQFIMAKFVAGCCLNVCVLRTDNGTRDSRTSHLLFWLDSRTKTKIICSLKNLVSAWARMKILSFPSLMYDIILLGFKQGLYTSPYFRSNSQGNHHYL